MAEKKIGGMTDEMNTQNREIDLDIVASSWRSLTQASGYGDLIDAWERKVSNQEETASSALVDDVLAKQLSVIDAFLAEGYDLKAEDPIEHALGETPAPAIVISHDGICDAEARAGAEFFGVTLGAPVETDWMSPDSIKTFRAVTRKAKLTERARYAIIRVTSGDAGETLAEVLSVPVQRHNTHQFVVRSLELEWLPDVSANLSQAFGLTEAETEVCRLLFSVRDLESIAAERGAAIRTVRNQLQAIFEKMEVTSKVELVRLLALVCARVAVTTSHAEFTYEDPLRNQKILVRKDGRSLSYNWTGRESGRPVLFVHGELPYLLMPNAARTAMHENNIRPILISMPGHGQSEVNHKIPQIEDGPDAIIELCDHLKLSGIAGMASFSGQYSLSRAAALRPDLFKSLLFVGLTWNLSDGRWRRLPISQRAFAGVARSAPKVFELLVRISYRRMLDEGSDLYFSRLYGENEVDRKTYTDPSIQPLLRPAFQHLANQGHLPMVREQEMVASNRLGDWMHDLDVPVHFLLPREVGKLNAEDIDATRALAARSTVEVVPNTGELLAYQTPELFIDRLVDALSEDPARAFAARLA